MPFGALFKDDILKLILQAVGIANLADNAAVSPLTNLYLAFHTAAAEAGDQTTNEIAYTPYARYLIARSAAAWAVASGVGTNIAAVALPMSTGAGGLISHATVGFAASGAGRIILAGTVTPNIQIAANVQPYFPAGSISLTLT